MPDPTGRYTDEERMAHPIPVCPTCARIGYQEWRAATTTADGTTRFWRPSRVVWPRCTTAAHALRRPVA